MCFEEPSKIDNIFMMKYFIVVNFIGQLCECSHYENCVRDFMKNQFRKLNKVSFVFAVFEETNDFEVLTLALLSLLLVEV